MEEAPKKGMSKGCLAGLIVGIGLVVIVVSLGASCYVCPGWWANLGVATTVGSVKVDLAENPVEGVDTVQFNSVADAFLAKFDSVEVDFVKYQAVVETVGLAMREEERTAESIEAITDAMIDYFPELEELMPATVPADTTAVEEPETTEEE